MMEVLQVLKYSLKQALREGQHSADIVSRVSCEAALANMDTITVAAEEGPNLLHAGHLSTFVRLVHEASGDLP